MGEPACALQLTVDGPDAIFGVLNFWATVNRHIEIKVIRVGEAIVCPLGGCRAGSLPVS